MDGDVRADILCPFCRHWNAIEAGKTRIGCNTFDDLRDTQVYECYREECQNPILRYEGEVYLRVKCQKCSALNEYPSRDMVQAKREGHNISQYQRDGRQTKTLVPRQLQ